MTLRHKILALTFDVVRRAICGITGCLPQTIIFELLASNLQHLFLNNTVVRHLSLVLEVPGSIPVRGEKNFGVRTRFL